MAITCHESTHICTHGIVITSSRETPSELCDLSASLVYCNDIPSSDLFPIQAINHLVSKVVYRFHIRSLDSQLAGLGSAREGSVHDDFYYFSRDDLGFLLDSDTYASSERLCQGFRFRHF